LQNNGKNVAGATFLYTKLLRINNVDEEKAFLKALEDSGNQRAIEILLANKAGIINALNDP